jgi:hypothetical protein
MADQNPSILPAVPWYQSPVQIAQLTTAVTALAAVSPKVAAFLGLTTPDAINTTVQNVCGGVSFLALLYGIFKRAKSPIQPLTLTQARADTHAATVGTVPVAETTKEVQP